MGPSNSTDTPSDPVPPEPLGIPSTAPDISAACARDIREEEGEPCEIVEAPANVCDGRFGACGKCAACKASRDREDGPGCFGLVETTAACVALVALVLGYLCA